MRPRFNPKQWAEWVSLVTDSASERVQFLFYMRRNFQRPDYQVTTLLDNMSKRREGMSITGKVI